MSQHEPPRPERGATGTERDRFATDLEREVTPGKTWPQKWGVGTITLLG